MTPDQLSARDPGSAPSDKFPGAELLGHEAAPFLTFEDPPHGFPVAASIRIPPAGPEGPFLHLPALAIFSL